jgi:hypothetical protein
MDNPLGPIYSVQFVLLLGCAFAFYRGAEMEDASGILWGGISIGLFLLTWRVFHFAYIGNLGGQALLIAAISGVRAFRAR